MESQACPSQAHWHGLGANAVAETKQADVTVRNEGTIFLVRPVSDVAKTWVDENVGEHQTWGDAIVVEHRYVGDLLEGMVADGLCVQEW